MRKKKIVKKQDIAANMLHFLKNQKIIRLLDENNKFIGEMTYQQAYSISSERNMELIVISNMKAKGEGAAIVKIGNLQKHLFSQKKNEIYQKQKSKTETQQQITMRADISDHDLENIKIKKIKEILNKGNRVKLSIFMRINYKMKKRGANPINILEKSKKLVEKVKESVDCEVLSESNDGKNYSVVLKSNKKKYNFKFFNVILLFSILKCYQ